MTDQWPEIWIVNQHYAGPERGGGTRHHDLASELVRLGYSVTIISGDTEATEVANRSVDVGAGAYRVFVLPAKAYKGNGLRRVLSMARFGWKASTLHSRSLDGRPAVIVGSSPHLFAAAAAYILAKRMGAKFMFEVRDIWPLSLEKLLGLSRWHPLVLIMRLIERQLLRRSDAVIGLMPGVGRYVSKVMPSQTNVAWIPNGVNLNGRDYRGPSKRSAASPFVVMYTGAHGPPNSLDTLLDAAEILALQAPGRFQFELFGDGSSKASLAAEVVRRGITSIEFHDQIPKPELIERLPSADAFVLLQRRTELYEYGISPNKLFDYLAAGRPVVIAIDNESDPVESSGAGLKVAAEDPDALAGALLALQASSDEEYEVYCRAARALAETSYDTKVLASRLSELVRCITRRDQ